MKLKKYLINEKVHGVDVRGKIKFDTFVISYAFIDTKWDGIDVLNKIKKKLKNFKIQNLKPFKNKPNLHFTFSFIDKNEKVKEITIFWDRYKENSYDGKKIEQPAYAPYFDNGSKIYLLANIGDIRYAMIQSGAPLKETGIRY